MAEIVVVSEGLSVSVLFNSDKNTVVYKLGS